MQSYPLAGLAVQVLHDTPMLEVVDVNDLIDNENLAYLLKCDTVYGRYPHSIDYNEDALIVTSKEYPVTHILWHRLPGARGQRLACGLAA